MSSEQKLDTLHEDIGKLFDLIESLSHKDHMLVDAVTLLHARLDDTIRVLAASHR